MQHGDSGHGRPGEGRREGALLRDPRKVTEFALTSRGEEGRQRAASECPRRCFAYTGAEGTLGGDVVSPQGLAQASPPSVAFLSHLVGLWGRLREEACWGESH